MAVTTWTVEDVCRGVLMAIESLFPDEFWVRGEIQGLRKSPAGHLYFDLIEPGAAGRGQDAKLSVVAFRGPLRGIEAVLRKVGNLELADGMEVRIRGRVDFYPPQGRIQFMMSAIDPRHTLGQLSADRDRVLRLLHEADLVEANGRLPVPLVPQRIGLVTSADSAAYNDFVHELEQSPHGFEVTFVDARVQGVEAEPTLVAALAELSRRDLDVIAVVRGGGAKGDLVAFDREAVARAVATAPVPVFVGIGHEIDRSVVDEVAHTSMKTPTACAAALIDRVAAFTQRLDNIASRTRHLAERYVNHRAQRLDTDAQRLLRATTTALNANDAALRRHRQQLERLAHIAVTRSGAALDRAAGRLPAAARRTLDGHERTLRSAEALVRAVHPDRTLQRGYSITRTTDGVALRSIEHTDVGHVLVTELLDGTVTTTVAETSPDLPDQGSGSS